jgi:hypothetical protein
VDLQAADDFTVAGPEAGTSGAGMLVYNTAETWGEPGIYVWDGTKWSKAGASTVTPPCDLPTISLPAADQSILSYGETTRRLAVTANGDDLSYQWESSTTGAAESWDPIEEAEDAAYDAPATATGSLYYHCIVSNGCGNVTSPQFTVNVLASLPVNGSYNLTGTRCYDIALSGNNLDKRTNDFAVSFVKPYSFKYDNSFTNLSYSILSDPSNIVSVLPQPSATSGTGTGTIAFNVTFNSNVRTIVGAGGSATARIAAFYTDNTGADKVAYIDVKVQDNTCCDGAVIVGGAFDYAAGYPANNGLFAGDGAKAGGASGTTAMDWSPDLNAGYGATASTALDTYFTAANQDLCVYKLNFKSSGTTNGKTFWDDAVNSCADGSYADDDAETGWYLPNLREFLYIYNAIGGTDGRAVNFGNLALPSYVATTSEELGADDYFTSTEYATTTMAYQFTPNSGNRAWTGKNNMKYVRCVRRI